MLCVCSVLRCNSRISDGGDENVEMICLSSTCLWCMYHQLASFQDYNLGFRACFTEGSPEIRDLRSPSFLISFFILKCWKLSKPKSWSQNHPKALGILAPQQLISTLVSLFQSICLHSSNNLYTDFLYWFSVGWFCRIRILWANHFLRKKSSTSLKLWTWIRWLLAYADFPLQSNC